MVNNLIFFSSNNISSFYAKLLRFQGVGRATSDLSVLLANKFIKVKTIIWVSSVYNSSIYGFVDFLKYWDDIRSKNIIFVLVGEAPIEHPIYLQVWSQVATPTMQKKIHFLPVVDKRPKFSNRFLQLLSDFCLPLYILMKLKFLNTTLNVRKCVELVD